ncbi:MAG: nucleoside deaminase [Verrucomicrobiota bacterium]
MKNHDIFMQEAMKEAKAGLEEGGIPIGSVLVRDGKIIGRGRNQRVQQGNAILHAEIHCLMNAGRQKTYRDTILYSTLSPCYLCSGAIVQFKIPHVVMGEDVNFSGAPEFLKSHGVKVENMMIPELIDIMKKFTQDQPELWNEDIAENS